MICSKMKDVRQITDIPEIENYLRFMFRLECYDVGDKTQIYRCDLSTSSFIIVELISDESLIEGIEELANLVTQENLHYFGFTIRLMDEIVDSYHYRPLIDESKKDYYEPKY